jgi:tRNA-dihydrouridine synthase
MGFSGHALWERIALLKKIVGIPVVGNGDITTPQKGLDMFSRTGCDSIMIGRGAYGSPWIFQHIKLLMAGKKITPITVKERLQTALLHLKEYQRVYGEERAAREMKKHLAVYTRGIEKGAVLRNRIFGAKNIAEMKAAVRQIFTP